MSANTRLGQLRFSLDSIKHQTPSVCPSYVLSLQNLCSRVRQVRKYSAAGQQEENKKRSSLEDVRITRVAFCPPPTASWQRVTAANIIFVVTYAGLTEPTYKAHTGHSRAPFQPQFASVCLYHALLELARWPRLGRYITNANAAGPPLPTTIIPDFFVLLLSSFGPTEERIEARCISAPFSVIRSAPVDDKTQAIRRCYSLETVRSNFRALSSFKCVGFARHSYLHRASDLGNGVKARAPAIEDASKSS